MDNFEAMHLKLIESLKQPQTLSLGLQLENWATRQGEKTALIYADRYISYEQFNQMANRYAHFFQQEGFKKGDVVSLLMDNRPEYLMAASGLNKLGVVVNLVNSVIRGGRLAHAINISESRALIIGHEFMELYQSVSNMIRLRTPGRILVETGEQNIALTPAVEDLNQLLSDCPTHNPESTARSSSEDLLIYMETAGSSGLRKAVILAQKRWLLMGQQFALLTNMNQDSIIYLVIPFYYNMGFNICFSSMLASGASMVIKPRFSLSNFWPDICRYKVTHFMAVGEMLRFICNQPEKAGDLDNPLEYIVGVNTRGDLLDRLHQRFGIKKIVEAYGTSEGVGTFINEEEIPGMCGNLDLRGMRQGEVVQYDFDSESIIRDDKGLAVICKPGEIGLVLSEINENNPFLGYVNDSEMREAKIIRDVLRKGDEYFNTGDLVKLHEGSYISFADRLGDTYRWKSKTVSAHQVGDVLNKFFGGIEEAFVYGVKIPGMEGNCGMAALQLMEDVALDWKSLVDHINRRMPDHARPVFIRICDFVDANLFRKKRRQLQEEGFDPAVVKDPLYYFDLERKAYLPLTLQKYQDIMNGKIRL
ncbi:MAG: long-chain-acyl-CoA synthetase [Syntrophomonas sp.]|uniref:long-chain-acyl-CoA synthetase n=1 Tax=Syntrophomonas sp. TaxID=2053627 RepID=UPI0026102F59|nr:long-chain-acyl-CoA synthetase [Syntrophomonas sp.]MDD2509763.1 long-chain-acyl-CoA synthetase [Syntrophomonas sp.]MDD3878833.1 long-chain-acyl-CoA synthetase [Syntrophomonas sp.]MDD4625744.1 long-chain-acyl-CoA synthetase [Syntrophomonas sp.]